MSNGPKMSYPFALNLAEHLVEILRPDCERIAIAGSIRRMKSEIGDVEIVLIPKPVYDLFDGEIFGDGPIEADLIREGFLLKKSGRFLKQAYLPPIANEPVMFDIYLTTREKWGVIFTIRTGCAEFSHKLVTIRKMNGLLPSYLRVQDGRVWHGGTAFETPEEEDFFRVIGLNWIPPEQRNQ